ncbi:MULTISPECIES: hypothetical protein [Pseudomonas]|nr:MULTISPECIES: hypothetical protein [Pseudomonas]
MQHYAGGRAEANRSEKCAFVASASVDVRHLYPAGDALSNDS